MVRRRRRTTSRKKNIATCFFNDTATTEIYTLSLRDALPILAIEPSATVLTRMPRGPYSTASARVSPSMAALAVTYGKARSEEHTSELQSRQYLACRLLLEKKKVQLSRTLTNRKHGRSPVTPI